MRRLPFTRIVLLVMLLIGIGATWAAGEIAKNRAMASVRRGAQASAALHGAVLRSELEKFRLVPLALAGDPGARAVLERRDPGEIRSLDARLERLDDSIHAAAIYLIDARGQTIAASNWKLPTSFVGSNYGFREYFRKALANGEHEQFALGTVSQHPGLYIARRIEAGGAAGVIVLKMEFDGMESDWAQSAEPAFVTDSRGIVLVTSVPAWRFLTLRDISPADRSAIRRNLDFGDAPLVPLPITHPRGAPARVVDARTSVGTASVRYLETTAPTTMSGWTLHMLTPIGATVAGAATSARLVTAMVALLAAIGVWLLLRRRRQRRERAAQAIAAREALEREVGVRTRELRVANEQLQVEMADRLAGEARLQETRDQLVQANRLASLGQIAAGVAHEINQPVAAISSYAHNGRQCLDLGRTADAADSLESIQAMTERIGAITGELRGFARKATGAIGAVVLDDAIDGALLLLRDRIARQGVAVDHAAAAVTVRAERIRLEQVLVNLLGNALDALGGHPSPIISVRMAAKRRWVDLDIANNGPAPAPAIAASLFTPFNTSKEDGLGLGLVISRDIMTDFGGDLSYVPTASGVTFRLRLARA